MTFEEWMNGIEGYGLRVERLVEEVLAQNKPYRERYKTLIEWVRAAYDTGYEHGTKHD